MAAMQQIQRAQACWCLRVSKPTALPEDFLRLGIAALLKVQHAQLT
eukprot:CAMPEP_0203927992 /NCGR_PEP_ID=MMETSP0359-20131031/67334_1 /ASSEMBLY_ACC=CAM_ASM_000338 /TAXON_ID=268821 /ORGANISM="Scrippsiella Hangoei, Strain SHTV-5" /LENGTH=45 /DNA_ID= /DNA_START= /DNA_END= /DNA_ORIENTATION=